MEQDTQGLCGTENAPEPFLATCQVAQGMDTLPGHELFMCGL